LRSTGTRLEAVVDCVVLALVVVASCHCVSTYVSSVSIAQV
jgi:hypothetical protein